MKNVQIIEGADNCTYDVFAFTDEEFSVIFPGAGQNVEFIEDAVVRIGDEELGRILRPVWKRRARKSEIVGIHGTLFYELAHKTKYYPTKKEEEMVTGIPHLSPSER
ncbi:MAG TPA: hypothetical protein VLX44_14230 [Xanthobacteraceae bacterium]|nr:hypothetical protein [Xanthobacteraceae bacterium]